VSRIRRARAPWKPGVVAALAGGATIAEGAEAGGVSSRTIDRWLREPGFREAVQKARTDLLDRAIGLLAAQAAQAIAVLTDIMTDPTAPAAARVSASRTVLEHPLRAREHGEMAARISELEATFAARTGHSGLAGGSPALRRTS
jgi:hypothetical protein